MVHEAARNAQAPLNGGQQKHEDGSHHQGGFATLIVSVSKDIHALAEKSGIDTYAMVRLERRSIRGK